MTNEPEGRNREVVDCVATIVCAYVANNALPASSLPALIASVQASLTGLGQAQQSGAADLTVTEAQIRKSITPDALISFIDGKTYKVLKRHLSRHGLDAQTYRRRYGLPVDYPMVAPSYSVHRTELSRFFGRGRPKQS